jgi:hypothetical protein
MTFKDWTHPKIANPQEATLAWSDLAAEANNAAYRREKTYPGLIKSGALDSDWANADREAWQLIAADWRWIAWGDGHPGCWTTIRQRIAALDHSLDTFMTMIDKQRGSMSEAQARAGANLAALRWWVHREEHWMTLFPEQQVRWLASVGHEFRKSTGRPTLRQTAEMHTQKGEAA